MSNFDDFMIEEAVKKNQDIAALMDTVTRLRKSNAQLLEALEQWKCPACNGSRFYTGYSKDAMSGQPCRKCKDTNGLHPTAWAAIRSAKGEL